MVPPAAARMMKKRKKAAALALSAMPTPSTAPATKNGKTTGKKKATKNVDLHAMPMWAKMTDSVSHCVMVIAHGQK
jgi:hypothetical protein